MHALAAHGGVVLAGTEAGAYATADGRSFAPLGGGMPGGAVTAVALRADGEALEAWLVTGGELWRAALARGAAGVRVAHAERAAVFGGGAGGPCVDVAVGLQGSDVVALAPDALAVRSVGEGAWRTLRPSFPPGASALRIGGALGRTWIATDRGLLVGPALEGPFERAPGGVGGEPVLALAGDASVVLAGTDEGLWSGRAAGDDGARRTTVWVDALPPAEPRIEAVHRAALAYLDLAPERMQRLREGAARRGFLPVVGVHLGRDVGRFQRRDDDESFVSGEVRRLHDRQRDRSHDYGAALSFEWELGDAAYDPEEVDVSKEAREVIELRDDVLDEITQLYFERRRVLLDLASAPPPEAARLRLRADELAAGLDAWTGGWFGRQVGRLAP